VIKGKKNLGRGKKKRVNCSVLVKEAQCARNAIREPGLVYKGMMSLSGLVGGKR